MLFVVVSATVGNLYGENNSDPRCTFPRIGLQQWWAIEKFRLPQASDVNQRGISCLADDMPGRLSAGTKFQSN